jgi:heat shock protein HtpX
MNFSGIAYHEAIASNKRKTNFVLMLYVFIYGSIGLLLDIVLMNPPTFSIGINLILSGHHFPIATISMITVAAIAIFIVMSFGEKIFLSGNDYRFLSRSDRLTSNESLLLDIVEELTISAGLRYTPRVALIEADYANAFATGWSEESAMVAITTRLFSMLNRDEIAAVMAHELTHIRNSDVRLTLVVGVLANIMLFVVNNVSLLFMSRGEKKGTPAIIAAVVLFALQFILPLITMMLQMFLSRKREYMADAGAVELTRDPEAMASALMKISGDYDDGHKDESAEASMRKAAYIFSSDGFFSTHPSLKNRLESIGLKN